MDIVRLRIVRVLLVVVGVVLLFFVGVWGWWGWMRGDLVCDSYYDFEGNPLPCGITRNDSDLAFFQLIGEIESLQDKSGEVSGVIRISDLIGKTLRVPFVVGGLDGGKIGLVNFSNSNVSEGQVDALYEAIVPGGLIGRIEIGSEIVTSVSISSDVVSSCAVEGGNALASYLKDGGIYNYLNYRVKVMLCPLRITQVNYY